MSDSKNTALLVFGSGVSQAITLGGTLWLTRLYTPEDFGVAAALMSIGTIVGVVSSLRYEMTILLPKRLNEVELATNLAFLISTMICLCVAVIALCYGLLAESDWASWWWYVPAYAYCSAITNIATFRQNRFKKYLKIGIFQVLRAATYILSAVAFAYLTDDGGNGLVVGSLLAMIVIATGLLLTERGFLSAYKVVLSPKHAKKWAKKHYKFPTYSAPAVFLGTTAAELPILLFTVFFGAQAAGYYSIVQRIIFRPVGLVSGAVNKVYMQNIAANLAAKRPVFPYSISLLKKALLCSVVGTSTLILMAYYETFAAVFGAQWQGIDALVMTMSPVVAISFIAKTTAGFAVLGKNEYGLIYQCLLLMAVLLSLSLSGYLDAPIESAYAALAISLCFAYGMQLASVLLISHKRDQGFAQ